MRTTIDKAGRVVIPAAMRERAGLSPGSELEVTEDDLGIRFSDGSFLDIRPRFDPSDPVYDLADWEGFETRGWRAPDLKLERLARGRVLEVCSRCGRDSHGAMSDARFGAAFFASHVQPLIDRVRERIRARSER